MPDVLPFFYSGRSHRCVSWPRPPTKLLSYPWLWCCSAVLSAASAPQSLVQNTGTGHTDLSQAFTWSFRLGNMTLCPVTEIAPVSYLLFHLGSLLKKSPRCCVSWISPCPGSLWASGTRCLWCLIIVWSYLLLILLKVIMCQRKQGKAVLSILHPTITALLH